MSGVILLGLVAPRGVDDDGAVAAPDEAEVPLRRRRASACLRAGCWLHACLVATRLLACMVLCACSAGRCCLLAWLSTAGLGQHEGKEAAAAYL